MVAHTHSRRNMDEVEVILGDMARVKMPSSHVVAASSLLRCQLRCSASAVVDARRLLSDGLCPNQAAADAWAALAAAAHGLRQQYDGCLEDALFPECDSSPAIPSPCTGCMGPPHTRASVAMGIRIAHEVHMTRLMVHVVETIAHRSAAGRTAWAGSTDGEYDSVVWDAVWIHVICFNRAVRDALVDAGDTHVLRLASYMPDDLARLAGDDLVFALEADPPPSPLSIITDPYTRQLLFHAAWKAANCGKDAASLARLCMADPVLACSECSAEICGTALNLAAECLTLCFQRELVPDTQSIRYAVSSPVGVNTRWILALRDWLTRAGDGRPACRAMHALVRVYRVVAFESDNASDTRHGILAALEEAASEFALFRHSLLRPALLARRVPAWAAETIRDLHDDAQVALAEGVIKGGDAALSLHIIRAIKPEAATDTHAQRLLACLAQASGTLSRECMRSLM